MANCKHLKIKINHSFECKKTGKLVDFKKCNRSNCKHFEYKEKEYKKGFLCSAENNAELCRTLQNKNKASIKKKSSKLAKLERNRYSVFTNDLNHCIICKKKKEHIHEIYFGSFRQRSIRFGMCIPLCSRCHSEMHRNFEWQEYWHIKGQDYFEKNIGTLEEFIATFGKSYIK